MQRVVDVVVGVAVGAGLLGNIFALSFSPCSEVDNSVLLDALMVSAALSMCCSAYNWGDTVVESE